MYIAHEKVTLSLLILRVTVFLVMFMWALDKFMNPAHAAGVFEHFYWIPGMQAQAMYVLGAAEMLLLLSFLLGMHKTFSYGFVLVFHSISTLAGWRQYLEPFEQGHLLFFAAWPMLGACLVLFILRDYDQRCVLDDN